MAFDFDEARATIENAKMRGLIRNSDSPDPAPSDPSAKTKPKEKPSSTILPDWLQNASK